MALKAFGNKPIIRIKNKGVANFNSSKRGDLLLKVKISPPKKLSKKAKKLIEELKKEVGEI